MSTDDKAYTTAQRLDTQITLLARTPADFTNFTVTAAAMTQCTKAWTIPAGDAKAGTTYRVTFIGNGTQGSTQQDLSFQILGVAGSIATINHIFVGVNASFNLKVVMEITVITTGVSGTANYFVYATAAGGPNTGFNQGAINTATAFTFEGQGMWSSVTGAPTFTCFQSYYERIGP